MTVETGIVATLVVLAVLVLWLSLRRRPRAVAPVIAASVKRLRPGLYQIDVTITNRGREALIAESLKRVRPRRAKLLAPIKQVSTKDGDFQVWADPDGDAPTTTVPVDLVLAPWGEGAADRNAEGHAVAWLFLSREKYLAALELELATREAGGRRGRYRFGVTLAQA
jgi:hypothetical protein